MQIFSERTLTKVTGGKWRFEEATPVPFARRPALRTQEMRRTRALRRVIHKFIPDTHHDTHGSGRLSIKERASHREINHVRPS
jgi:hypothetical protein